MDSKQKKNLTKTQSVRCMPFIHHNTIKTLKLKLPLSFLIDWPDLIICNLMSSYILLVYHLSYCIMSQSIETNTVEWSTWWRYANSTFKYSMIMSSSLFAVFVYLFSLQTALIHNLKKMVPISFISYLLFHCILLHSVNIGCFHYLL